MVRSIGVKREIIDKILKVGTVIVEGIDSQCDMLPGYVTELRESRDIGDADPDDAKNNRRCPVEVIRVYSSNGRYAVEFRRTG